MLLDSYSFKGYSNSLAQAGLPVDTLPQINPDISKSKSAIPYTIPNITILYYRPQWVCPAHANVDFVHIWIEMDSKITSCSGCFEYYEVTV